MLFCVPSGRVFHSSEKELWCQKEWSLVTNSWVYILSEQFWGNIFFYHTILKDNIELEWNLVKIYIGHQMQGQEKWDIIGWEDEC